MSTTSQPGIHIVINGWFVGQPATGSGQYIEHLLTQLPGYAPEVRWSLLLPTGQRTPKRSASRGVEVHSVRLPDWPENLAKLWWEQVIVPRQSRALAADLLWVPYWAAPLWQPLPVVVTVHDLIPLLLPAYRGGWLQRRYTDLVRYTAGRSAAIITVSEASARDVVTRVASAPGQVQVVYHGPNQAESAQPDQAALAGVRAKFHLPDRFFLYLGGFDVRKNVSASLAAYRRYLDKGGDPAVGLVIAGRLPASDTPFSPDPQRIAAQLNLSGQVTFCGWVDEDEKQALYHLATAFLFPSLYEGFGMMVLEAMSAGAPVITSAS